MALVECRFHLWCTLGYAAPLSDHPMSQQINSSFLSSRTSATITGVTAYRRRHRTTAKYGYLGVIIYNFDRFPRGYSLGRKMGKQQIPPNSGIAVTIALLAPLSINDFACQTSRAGISPTRIHQSNKTISDLYLPLFRCQCSTRCARFGTCLLTSPSSKRIVRGT